MLGNNFSLHFINQLKNKCFFFSVLCLSVKLLCLVAGTVFALSYLFTGISHVKSMSKRHHVSIFHYMLGHYLEPKNTNVIWEWQDPHVVGETMSFYIKVHVENERCVGGEGRESSGGEEGE